MSLCKIGLHWYRRDHDTSVWDYVECKWCGNREVIRKNLGGYQPVDKYWLERKPYPKLCPPDGVLSGARKPSNS